MIPNVPDYMTNNGFNRWYQNQGWSPPPMPQQPMQARPLYGGGMFGQQQQLGMGPTRAPQAPMMNAPFQGKSQVGLIPSVPSQLARPNQNGFNQQALNQYAQNYNTAHGALPGHAGGMGGTGNSQPTYFGAPISQVVVPQPRQGGMGYGDSPIRRWPGGGMVY